MSDSKSTESAAIVYGYDKGSPEGDQSALTIYTAEGAIYTFVGKDAEVIMQLFDQELAKRVEEAELNQIDFIDEMFRIIGPDISKVLNACRNAIKPSLTNQTNKGEE